MYHSRHILVRPKPSAPDINATVHFLDSIRTLIVAKKLSFEKATNLHSDDKASKGKGGMLTDEEEGGTRISVETLETGLFMTLDTMKVNTISRPITYRLEDGKDAVRLVYYKSVLAPHYMSLETDYQRIYTAALAEERNKLMMKWFEKMKKELFIDIDPEFKDCDVMKNL